MKNHWKKVIALTLAGCLLTALFSGCGNGESRQQSGEHEPLSIMTAGMNYNKFEELLKQKYPEIRLEYISYTGNNATGYSQYLMANNEIPDIYAVSVFSQEDKQPGNLLDLSGYKFLSNYKTADINQVTLDGAVYLVPASLMIIGIYYNKTMFAEYGWEVPHNLEELKALALTIREAGIDPMHAQFELPGNGFFDLFTMAKTNYLSTPEGRQWERDFQVGEATAAEGLTDAAALLQELIDCGLLDAEDAARSDSDTRSGFENREAAMYLNAGSITKFTQNEDGTGDQYGLIPYFGKNEEDTVLITLPVRYYGLSKNLDGPGKEQKLEDALKVMELLATEEGQQSLLVQNVNYVAPLKNSVIPPESPFQEVADVLGSGHTSTLAYAGYEPIIIPVGEKVRDWVAGKCTGADVLTLMDQQQADYLNHALEPVAEAAEDFTREETAQLQAEAFRQAAGTDIGMITLGDYHDGYENYSGVCGRLFRGDISQDVVNAMIPAYLPDTVWTLTLSGAEIKSMMEEGLIIEEGVEGFTYVPSGITVTKNKDGSVKKIIMADGSGLDESAGYTVAIDDGGFTEEIGKKGAAQDTGLVVADIVGAYMSANSPLVPLEPSVK